MILTKKRCLKTNQLHFNDMIKVIRPSIIPRQSIKKFRRIFKKQVKIRKKKIILNIKLSYIVSYKGKNPRMGRGSGNQTRLAYTTYINQEALFLRNFSGYRYASIKRLFKKFKIILL